MLGLVRLARRGDLGRRKARVHAASAEGRPEQTPRLSPEKSRFPLDGVTELWLDNDMTTKRIPTANNLYVRLVGNAARGYIASVERRNGTQVAATDTFPFAAAAATAGHELAAAQ